MRFATRVKIISETSSGTINLYLGATPTPEPGYQAPGDLFADNVYLPYMILDANGVDWEMGVGWLEDSGTTFDRGAIIGGYVQEGTNGSSLVDLSSGKHTLFIGPPAFMADGVFAQLFTSTAQSLTNGVQAWVSWSTEVDTVVHGTSGGPQGTNIWKSSNANKILVPAWAKQVRVSGQIAFNATSVAAGRYELEVVHSYGTGVHFHTEAVGDATNRTYMQFERTIIGSDNSFPGDLSIGVKRVGDDTGAGLYTPHCYLYAEIIR